ncbi:MAG: hypothetical protein NW224_10565 [Leptolyngbyaceae cyanobacterium bins.302]|nr:hypothetical protein [Leptolyngbyaceae cyanobacterium bins.302]
MGSNEMWAMLSRRAIAVGSVLLAMGVLLDMYGLPSFGSRRSFAAACQGSAQTEAKLTKEQLAKLLSVPEGAQKQQVREITKEPYCQLASLQIRAGATAQREAYRLSFDSDTWLVVLYEGEQYTGYRFTSSQ